MDDAYWNALRTGYSNGLAELIGTLPPPPRWDA